MSSGLRRRNQRSLDTSQFRHRGMHKGIIEQTPQEAASAFVIHLHECFPAVASPGVQEKRLADL